ncbi:Fumarate/succinate/L-aspartate dehydrogenases, partial [hydrothermal vent metagenome]
MTDQKKYETDIAIIGGGIAGITLALELLEGGERRRITILEGQDRQDFGGLAKSAFGGMMLVDTPEQKKSGITDSHELALKDWHDFADFDKDDHWPRAWAAYYVENVTPMVRDWILALGLKFLPAVQWVERGLFQPGNSVPRYHILYGTARYLMTRLISRLERAAKNGHLTLLFNHKARKFITDAGAVSGIEGDDVKSGRPFSLMAGTIIIATGGIGGNHDKVRQNWPVDWPKAPDRMLNGCHPSADGHFHDQTQDIGGRVTHLDRMWNYAAGIPHPQPRFDNHGLSLVPTRSSLWLDHRGQRIGPLPLITGFDTNFLCRQVVAREKPWSWHVMNWKIARRELAISGAEHNPDLRERKFLRLVLKLLFADDGLLRQMVAESDDFIVADNLAELTDK